MRLAVVALAATAMLPSCERKRSFAPSAVASVDPPAPSATASARAVANVSPELSSPLADPPRVRVRVADDARVLRPHAAVVDAHFGGPRALELQMVGLAGDRRAVLVSAAEGDARSMLLVVDGRNNLLWSRERPLAGMRPGVRQVALCAGPDGEALAVWHDTDSSVVAARRWAADGGLLADFTVMDADGCDAIAALYWPQHGWVIVASRQGSARAQLLGERGQRAWGNVGRSVAPGFRGPAPIGLALDGEDGVVVVQPGYAANGLTRDVADRWFATRLDDGGRATWSAPIDLGEAPRPGRAPLPKPQLSFVEDGVVAVTLARGTTDAPIAYEIELTARGQVRVR